VETLWSNWKYGNSNSIVNSFTNIAYKMLTQKTYIQIITFVYGVGKGEKGVEETLQKLLNAIFT
jgi:hypothetical protein